MFIVKSFILIEPEDYAIYSKREDAQSEANHVMLMQPGEVIAVVEELDWSMEKGVENAP